MKKLFKLSTIFLLALTLAACSGKKNNDNNTPNDLEENTLVKYEPIVDSFSADKAITNMEFINVPTEPIEIGKFAYSNIILQANFIDGTKERMHVTESFFRSEQLADFKTPGQKYYDFLYKGNHIPLRFELKEAKTYPTFTVEFRDKDGSLLDSKVVKYLEEAKYSGKKDLGYLENNKYYMFTGEWDKDIEYVYSNMSVKPKFKECPVVNSYDNYYLENLYEYSIVKCEGDSSDKHALVYMGRINDATLVNLDTQTREHYKDTVFEYTRDTSYSRLNFAELINNNLINNVLLNNYCHDSFKNPWYQVNIWNGYLLNFDSSNCITRDISDLGYNLSDLTPISRSGYSTSYKSVINHMYTDPYNVYMADDANILTLTEDYPLGNYQLCLMSDLDVYLDIHFEITEDNGYQNYKLTSAKLAVCYLPETIRMDFKYSSDDITTYSNKFVIYDAHLLDTLYEYINFN